METVLLDFAKWQDLTKVQKSRARQELRELTQSLTFTNPDKQTIGLDRKVLTAAMHSR